MGFNTRTIVFDFTDLDNPQPFFEYFGTTPAVDHNGYTKGDIYYVANYSAGFRAIDISDIENGNISEYGFFDTAPDNNNANFGGAWNVYPYFASGNVVISGQSGFTLVRDPLLERPDVAEGGFTLFPNPASDYVVVSSTEESLQQAEVYNVLGQRVLVVDLQGAKRQTIDISALKAGLYMLKINGNTTKRLIVN